MKKLFKLDILAVFFFLFLFFSFLFYPIFYPKESYALGCSSTSTYSVPWHCQVTPPPTSTGGGGSSGLTTSCTTTDDSCPAGACQSCEFTGSFSDSCRVGSGVSIPLFKLVGACYPGYTKVCTTTWNCANSYCDGCTYRGSVSCGGTGNCSYGTSYLSNTCGAGCVPTPTPGCTGSSVCQANGSVCCLFTWAIRSGVCSFACHTACTGCTLPTPTPVGQTPTPPPTPTPVGQTPTPTPRPPTPSPTIGPCTNQDCNAGQPGLCYFCNSGTNSCQAYSPQDPICTGGPTDTPPPDQPTPEPCYPRHNEQIAPLNSYSSRDNDVTIWGPSSSLVVSATGSGNFYLDMNNSCEDDAAINSVAVPFANYYTTALTYTTYTSSGTYCSLDRNPDQLACPSATAQCTAAGNTNCRITAFSDNRTGNRNCDIAGERERGDTYSSSCTIEGTKAGTTYGAAITPKLNSCSGLPAGQASCSVNGNNAPLGLYTATVISSNIRPTENKTFPLNVYVVNPSRISYTCEQRYSQGNEEYYNVIILRFKDFGGTYYCAYSGSDPNELGCASGPGNGTRTNTITVTRIRNGIHDIKVLGWRDNRLIGGMAEALDININSGVCTTSTPTPSPTATPATPPPGSNVISGNVFVDTNKNQLFDSSESNYTGGTSTINIYLGSQVSGSPYQTVTTNTGAFTTGNVLPTGTYTVSYTGLPQGYKMTIPINGPPPSFTVTVGNPGCDVGSSKDASCAGGNITNLNYGITNSLPWCQSAGGGDIGGDGGLSCDCIDNNSCDITITPPGGGGFIDPIPPNPLPICGGAFASIPADRSITPGLIFTGIGPTDFGQGSASLKNWVVGETNGSINLGGFVKTSYAYLQSVAKQAGITPVDLNSNPSFCSGGGLNNCELSPTLPNGIYIANGNLTLGDGSLNSSYTFPLRSVTNTGNFIILIGKNPDGTNGNLNIKTQLLVPNGSTALFSASGNIEVDTSVGASYTTVCAPSAVSDGISTGCHIEGIFSADQNFIIDGLNDCTNILGSDLKLNVAGNIVTNAALNGGTFVNRRDLCENNIYCPVFTIQSRPDFILNAPDFLKKANYTWQELAP